MFRLKEEELNDSLKMEDVSRWDSLTHMDLISTIEDAIKGSTIKIKWPENIPNGPNDVYAEITGEVVSE